MGECNIAYSWDQSPVSASLYSIASFTLPAFPDQGVSRYQSQSYKICCDLVCQFVTVSSKVEKRSKCSKNSSWALSNPLTRTWINVIMSMSIGTPFGFCFFRRNHYTSRNQYSFHLFFINWLFLYSTMDFRVSRMMRSPFLNCLWLLRIQIFQEPAELLFRNMFCFFADPRPLEASVFVPFV